jgi:glucose dehydrogenase
MTLRSKSKKIHDAGELVIGASVLLALATGARAQGEWPAIGQDAGSQRYSSLKQIDRKNVGRLRWAWTYDTGLKGRTFEATPLVIQGVMYFTTPEDHVIALNASTGKEIWKFDPEEKSVRGSRGVAYWPGDPKTPPRIVMGTSDGRLIELDIKTGNPVESFADHGQLDLKEPATDPSFRKGFQLTSPPAIYRNIAIVAPATQEGPSRGMTGNGDPRAYDILTGKLVWRFHSMPREGEFGSDTWGAPDGWKDRSGPSAWSPMSIDEKRGIAFVATGNPADSYYGADRKGQNLYANCILALDAATGKLLWYFQTVHHDTWDADNVGTALIDVDRNGMTIPAVAILNKTALLFILDRTFGKPIFGVEERPVPKSDVPGEESWPTQPFTVKPPQLTRNSMTSADLTKMTPPSAQACAEKWSTAHNSGPYTPLGLTPTVNFPSAIGGANWGGVSYDPALGYVFVNTSELGVLTQMVPEKEGSPMPYRNIAAVSRWVGPDGFPCQQPPWGMLTAVNVNTGDVAWSVPLGNYDDLGQSQASIPPAPLSLPDGPGKTETVATCSICHALSTVSSLRLSRDGWADVINTMVSRGMQVSDADRARILEYLAQNFPPSADPSTGRPATANRVAHGSPLNSQPTGTPNIGASAVTAGGLVFIGGTLDNKLRAFDSQTGKELWSAKLDGVGVSGPVTYLSDGGKQMIAITVGGPGSLRAVHNHASESPDEIVAFTLP